ncbi:AraC-like DNA-binding protein [Pseudoduganella flava]|uniref:AraC-like DNA-binding protein n=1 Tax=Pseudoduganella flava TaxID=871742 RepID=A0A562P7B3_9BURK|nr:AraC-like DNA-binding protein [Pseudoduganella flava]
MNRAGLQPRAIHARAGIGTAAHVLQGRELEVLRVHVGQAALILVDRGIKTVRTERGGSVRATPGQALVLAADQTVDFTNTVPHGSDYEARWLLFDGALLGDAYYLERASQVERDVPAHLLPHVSDNLAAAFERSCQALHAGTATPGPIARQRLLEVLHWLLEDGIALRTPSAGSRVADRVRALITPQLDADWTSKRVAVELALSEATLRRRLAAEGTTLTELLTDARMSTALTMLQATTYPVTDIALSVGYESASRFAVRFRQRFGFAPTALRGHERAA